MKNILKKQFLPLIALGAFALGGCGENAKEAKNRIEDGLDLQGSYQTKASKEISIRANGIGCIIDKLDVTLRKMTITQVAYEDAACKGKRLGELITEGTISIGDELGFEPGARSLDYKIRRVFIRPLDASWLKILGIDASSDCNVDKLAVGRKKEVTGTRCGALGDIPAKDEIYFTSYVIDSKQLRFTKLPNEAPDHVGTKENPAERNEDLVITYKKT